MATEGRMPGGRPMPTDAQVKHVTGLQRRLGFRRTELNAVCLEVCGAEFAALDKAQVSRVIDRLKELAGVSEGAG